LPRSTAFGASALDDQCNPDVDADVAQWCRGEVMSGVFVSYRVAEQPGYATLLHQELVSRFGLDRVFLASRSIRSGDDYVEAISRALQSCHVLLAIIGPQWTDLLRDSERDWVYVEVSSAFSLGLRVVPVLIEDAELPATHQLPEGVAALSRCQYVRIRHYSIAADLQHLVAELEQTMPHTAPVLPLRSRTDGLTRAFRHPNTTVRVVVGDLFDQPGQLVVGFTDTFDTDASGDLVVSRNTLQAQLLERIYDGDVDRLDVELAAATAVLRPVRTESEADKPLGKLHRYPLGSVAVLRPAGRRVFCCAYSTMGNDLIAKSTVDTLWASLGSLWSSVARHGGLEPLTMPVVGSDLARIDPLNRENLIKLILMSYVARSREAVFCRELTIVVHPKDIAEISLPQIAAFLRRL
jgi:hypothetical protein